MNTRLILWALLWAAAWSPSLATADEASDASTAEAGKAHVRVATLNVYNYLSMDRRIDGHFHPNFPKPEAEKAGIRAVVHAVNPDVLALQELGPAPYLEELRQDLIREGLRYGFSYLLEAADPERHVALLSKLPFAEVTGHPKVEFTYFNERELVKRGMIEARFGEGEGAWTLFIVHLKSRFTTRPDDPMSETRRTLEARALRKVILDRFPDPTTARYLIAGDINDTTRSRAVVSLLHRGKTTISTLLPTTDSRGETWTHRYLPEDSYTRVDFLLPSPGFVHAIMGRSAVVYDGPNTLSGTDHRVVYADIDPSLAPEKRADVEPSSESETDETSDEAVSQADAAMPPEVSEQSP